MCVDPISASLIAVSVAGSAVQTYGAYTEAKAAQEDAKANARIAQFRGLQQEIEMERQFEIQQSKNIAIMGASGLSLTSGSFEAFLKANEDQQRSSLAVNKFNTRVEVQSYRSKARAYGRAAGLTIVGGMFNAASAGLGAYTPGGGSAASSVGKGVTKPAKGTITATGMKG